MNPRAEGAFEAISYIRQFAKRYGDSERFKVLLERELEALIDDVASGTAVDFRLRLRSV
jgi:ribosomal protein L31E